MNKSTEEKHVLLCVTSSVAIYKSLLLLRLLIQSKHQVRVVMSQNSTQFIQPLMFQSLLGNEKDTESGEVVYVDTFSEQHCMAHIGLAKWADLIVIAPASANIIAKYAQGLADDLMSTLLLATEAPVWIAPAMNQMMWHHPMVQKNLNKLKKINVHILEPESGVQACGDVGVGRMMEPEEMMSSIYAFFASSHKQHSTQGNDGDLQKNLTIMITAGPTQEALDPVRYISNRASGQTGYALAEAWLSIGAKVILISGPTALMFPNHHSCEYIEVISAEEMHKVVMHRMKMGGIDVFIGAAAVSDFRPTVMSSKKLKVDKQSTEVLSLNFKLNPDIIAEVVHVKSLLGLSTYVVGFALESHDMERHALEKLKRKKLDLLVANSVNSQQKIYEEPFGDLNAWTLMDESGIIEVLPRQSKKMLVKQLVHVVIQKLTLTLNSNIQKQVQLCK